MASKRKVPSIARMFTEMAILVVLVVVLSTMVWNALADNAPAKQPDDLQNDPVSTQETTTPVETTEPPFSIPDTATGMQAMQMYADEYGYELSDYGNEDHLARLAETYDKCPETRDFILRYVEEKDKTHTVDMTEFKDVEGVPLFIQWDDRWGYTPYGRTVGGISACGPTCLSMVAWYYTKDESMTPEKIMKFATDNKYVNSAGGTEWTLFSKGGEKLGFEVEEVALVKKWVADKLEAGIPVICHVREGIFTTEGHYILLVGYEDGKFIVNDPNSVVLSSDTYTWEQLTEECVIGNLWAVSYTEKDAPAPTE
ncbi:MAG: C39 family peptidase [Oscillospiraceae bacterium]|nr:C39 family peptidase [Oscillospiraceae bacterium]